MTALTTMTAASFTGQQEKPLVQPALRIATDIQGTLIAPGDVIRKDYLHALIKLRCVDHEVFFFSGVPDDNHPELIKAYAERLQLTDREEKVVQGAGFFKIHGKVNWDRLPGGKKPFDLVIDDALVTGSDERGWLPPAFCCAQIWPQKDHFTNFVTAVLADPMQDIRALVKQLVPVQEGPEFPVPGQ